MFRMKAMEWRSAFFKAFGKRAKNHWSAAARDFYLLDQGIKSAFIFDHWASTADSMHHFTLQVQQQGLIQNDLQVLSIGLDVVICCPKYLVYDGCCPLVDTKFIDVSAVLAAPVVTEDKKLLCTSSLFQHLCHMLSERLDSEKNSVYDVEISPIVNVPCLFGLLLGYPCVYWYDRLVSDENCLTTQPLHLFQVKGHLIPGPDMVKPSPKPCIHMIFSFTVPEHLNTIHCHVAEWFIKWKDIRPWAKMFSTVWLEESVVCPQAVCL